MAASVGGACPRGVVGDTVVASVVASVDWPANCCACPDLGPDELQEFCQ